MNSSDVQLHINNNLIKAGTFLVTEESKEDNKLINNSVENNNYMPTLNLFKRRA